MYPVCALTTLTALGRARMAGERRERGPNIGFAGDWAGVQSWRVYTPVLAGSNRAELGR